MYLIPKNIKIKKEIFKGFGIIEIIILAISLGFGYFFSTFPQEYRIKIFLFCIFPLSTFLLLLPLPNGITFLKILKKFIIYKIKQINYKIK